MERLYKLHLTLWITTLLAIGLVNNARATTVELVTFTDLIDRAELIVEGSVQRTYSQYDDAGRFIWTHAEVRVTDVLKGQPTTSLIELKFMGGTVGDMTLEVTDMNYPAVGDSSVFFIESATRQQMHPLVGWDQGRFQVQPGTAPHVANATGTPITSIANTSLDQLRFSAGTAHGIQTRDADASTPAMTLAAFKLLIETQVSRDEATHAQ